MLSVGIMDTKQAGTYYKSDYNYYKSEQENAVFQGKLSELEALNNIEITQENFNNNLPKTARAGIDLTFTSAKSISIVALTTNDEKLKNILLESHQQAVLKVMKYTEENLIYTRITENGVQVPVKTNNMMYAAFNHYDSRETEPDLHTHNFIFNKTMDKNGKIRHIEALPILKNVKDLGRMFRLEQAEYLRERGIKINVTNEKQFFFELNGIDQSLIDKFSTRRQQIVKKKAELSKIYNDKNLINTLSNKLTKKAKKHTILQDNIINWQNELKELNFNPDIIKISKDIQPLNYTKDNINSIIDDKLVKLSEFNSSFSEIQLKNELKQSFLEKNIFVTEPELNNYIIMNNNIVKKSGQNVYTTKEIQAAESNILNFTIDNKEHTKILNTDFKANLDNWEKSNFKLKNDQAEALKAIIEQKDNMLIISGSAGSGKTTLLKALQDVNTKNNNHQIIGLAMEGKAASEMQQASGIQSQTIDSFLINKDNIDLKNSTLIIDEAGKLSTKKLEKLTEIAKENDCKIVLIGDRKQLSSINAGGMFTDLQNQVKTVNINTNVRQKNQEMQDIVNNFASGKTETALDQMNTQERIVYTFKNKIHDDIVNFYIENNGYKDTVILANTNQDVNILNNRIRKELLESNVISSENKTINTLISKNISEYDKKSAKNYESGDIIIAGTDKMQVLSVNTETNKIFVKNLTTKKNNDISAADSNKYQIYTEQKREFSNGDKIVFLKNDKNLLIKNGQSATIEKIENNNIIVKLEIGKSINIDTSQYNFINHGYALTTTKSQGMSAERGIILDDGRSDFSSDYVKISRFKHDVKIFSASSLENIKQRAGIFQEQVSFSKKSEIDIFDSKKAVNILSDTMKQQQQIRQQLVKPLEIKRENIKTFKRSQSLGL
jgi:conjugative relaxase-like TrwC/TraI family protein